MPNFAVFVQQNDGFDGPSGFVAVEADTAVAACAVILDFVGAYDRCYGHRTCVWFALPYDSAVQAVGPDGGVWPVDSIPTLFPGLPACR